MLSRSSRSANWQALKSTALGVQHRSFTPSVSRGIVDRTRKNNDSSQGQKDSHHQQATKAGTSGSSQYHPAKQGDPQQSPSKSTGIEVEGFGSAKSGVGSEPKEGVYQDKEVKKQQAQKEKEGGRESSMIRGDDKGSESLAEGYYDSSKRSQTSPFAGGHGKRHPLDNE